MKIAIIGAGGIADKAYFPLLGFWPGIDVVGIYSRTPATIERIRKVWGFENGTTDIEEILRRKPQAVVVITSTNTHFEFCKLFLEAGIDVYSEKSLTPASAESFELGRIAEKHNRILAVGFNRRYALLYRQAKEIFGSRKVQFALFQKHRTMTDYETLDRLFLDDIIHQIDLARFYCGDLVPLTTSYTLESGLITGAVSLMKTAGGGQCVVAASKRSGAWMESADVHGEGMTLHVDAFERLVVHHEDHQEIYGTDRPGKWVRDMRERGFYGQLDHFFECVRTRQQPLTSAWEAAKTLELMEGLIAIASPVR